MSCHIASCHVVSRHVVSRYVMSNQDVSVLSNQEVSCLSKQDVSCLSNKDVPCLSNRFGSCFSNRVVSCLSNRVASWRFNRLVSCQLSSHVSRYVKLSCWPATVMSASTYTFHVGGHLHCIWNRNFSTFQHIFQNIELFLKYFTFMHDGSILSSFMAWKLTSFDSPCWLACYDQKRPFCILTPT